MIPNSGLDAYTAFSGTEFLTQNSDSAPSAISDGVDPLSSGALNFSGGETMEVEIDGKKYRITNNLSTSQQLSYSVENGVTKFICSIFTITAVDKDVAYNLDIAGKQNTVITGNMDDTVTFSLTYGLGSSNTLYAGAGNDTINNYGSSSNIYGGDGDDVINVIGGYSSRLYGGSGNDTITLNDLLNRAYGEDGDDYIEINAGSSQGFGGDGNDSFSVMSGSSSRIDGGSGTNTLLRDNGTNTVAVNVDGANAFSETFAAGETKTILIDGLRYEVTNTSDEEQNFIYKINGDETEFWTGKFTIKAKDDDVSHNIRMMDHQITYYCGNAGDTVHTDEIGGTIYGGDGNDVMIGTGSNGISYFFGGKGNDSITIGNPLLSYVDAGDGDDVITVNSNGYGSGTGGTDPDNPDGGGTGGTDAGKTPPVGALRLQIGADSTESSAIYVDTEFDLGEFEVDFTSADSCASAIEDIDEALSEINRKRAEFGAVINRINTILTTQTITIQNYSASKSTIMDADIATESAEYVKNQILQQTSSTLLAQSENLHSSIIMSLIS